VQRRRFLDVADREVLHGLFLAALDDFEVVFGQPGDRLALLVDDGDAEVDEIHRRAERRLLSGQRQRAGEQSHDDRRNAVHGVPPWITAMIPPIRAVRTP